MPSLRSRRALVASIAAVLVVLAAVAIGVVALTWGDDDAAPARPRPALVTPTPVVNPVDPNAPAPAAAALTTQVGAALADPGLGKLTGVVTDARTGQVLWSSDPTAPQTAASVTKLLVASAALLTFDPTSRITTNVVEGPGGQVILVGAGDPTLSAAAPGEKSWFTDAPRIADLARQLKANGVTATSVAVDTSAYTGPTFVSSWERADIAAGNITPIEPVMLDSGRTKQENYAPRTDTPAADAAAALAKELGVKTSGKATAPQGAKVLAGVRSATLSVRLRDMMIHSDNVLAETLAIDLAKQIGAGSSHADGLAAIRKVLGDKGIDLSGVSLADASGLSEKTTLPAKVLDDLLVAASGDAEPRLRPLLDTLPVAAASGTLADRFSGPSGVAAGWARAKTGTLSETNSLAGIVQDVDGRVLAFALVTNGTSADRARPSLDNVVAQLRRCGCR